MGPEHIRVLLVEDNPADAELTVESLKSCKILCDVTIVPDGEQAMAYLRNQDDFRSVPRPDMVLLDLNLPRKSGLEVLQEMKDDGGLRRIPVVVLTSSQAEEDVVRSYDLQASAYVTKPVDLKGFAKIVKAIDSFWFSVVRYSQE